MKKKIKLGFALLLSALTLGGIVGAQTPTKLSAISPAYLHGWEYFFDGEDGHEHAEGTVTLLEGEIEIDVTKAGAKDFYAKFERTGVALQPGDYQWKVVAKASRLVKANFIVAHSGSALWNQEITEEYQDYVVDFHLANLTVVDLQFQYGGNWDENKSGPYKIQVRELELSKVSNEVYSETFDEGKGSFGEENHGDVDYTLEHDPVAATLEYVIKKFGPDEPWHIRLRSGETGIPVLPGERYRVDAKVDASAYKQYELSITDTNYFSEDRTAAFFEKHFDAGLHDLSLEFVAEKPLSDLRLNFEMGKIDPLVGGNITLIFDDIKIFKFVPSVVISEVSVKFYKTVAEFADELATIDSCVAGDDGYGAVQRLQDDFVVHLIDPEAMETTYVTDYDYTLGQGSGEKVADAVTVSAKWAMLQAMYQKSLPPGGVSGVNNNQNNIIYALLIGGLGITCLLAYAFIQRKKTTK